MLMVASLQQEEANKICHKGKVTYYQLNLMAVTGIATVTLEVKTIILQHPVQKCSFNKSSKDKQTSAMKKSRRPKPLCVARRPLE